MTGAAVGSGGEAKCLYGGGKMGVSVGRWASVLARFVAVDRRLTIDAGLTSGGGLWADGSKTTDEGSPLYCSQTLAIVHDTSLKKALPDNHLLDSR